MKKIMAAVLSLAIALGLAACGSQSQEGETPGGSGGSDSPVSGGWAINSGDLSMSANPDVLAAFEKAAEGLDGYVYEPLVLLGNQVVAGMNYQILCRGTAVAPDAVPAFEIVTIYADLEGGAEITNSVALPGLPEDGENLLGGWTVNTGDTTLDANPEVKTALETALVGLTGAEYEAAAFLASQVVAGNNYLIFCRLTPVVPDPVPSFAVVKIYADLDGNAEITELTDVTI